MNMLSTDFGSKGLYKETSTTKSQSIFQETANLKLSGNTFDAQHLSNFLNKPYCQSGSPSKVLITQCRNKWSNSLINNQLRQSSSFASIDREHPGQQKEFFEKNDSPFCLLYPNQKYMTQKKMKNGDKNIYDVEREQVYKNRNLSISIQSFQDDGLIKNHKQRFQENKELKEQLQRYKDLKQTFMFVNKRDRILRNGWKHGITGIELPSDPGTQVFKEPQLVRDSKEQEKSYIASGECSSQIEFGRSGIYNKCRKDDKIVSMFPQWKSKQVSPVRFQDSHEQIFVPCQIYNNPLRASKLKQEEKRGRPYNLINGDFVDLN